MNLSGCYVIFVLTILIGISQSVSNPKRNKTIANSTLEKERSQLRKFQELFNTFGSTVLAQISSMKSLTTEKNSQKPELDTEKEKPSNKKPNGKPSIGKPSIGKPYNRKRYNGKPSNEKPSNGKPSNEKPSNEIPSNEILFNEIPSNEIRSSEGNPFLNEVASGMKHIFEPIGLLIKFWVTNMALMPQGKLIHPCTICMNEEEGLYKEENCKSCKCDTKCQIKQALEHEGLKPYYLPEDYYEKMFKDDTKNTATTKCKFDFENFRKEITNELIKIGKKFLGNYSS